MSDESHDDLAELKAFLAALLAPGEQVEHRTSGPSTYTLAQAAAELNVSKEKVRELVHAGHLDRVKNLPHRIIIKRSSLEAFINA